VWTPVYSANHTTSKLEGRYKMRTKFLFVFLLLGAFLCFTQPAGAASITFEFDIEFSGAQEPEGSPPWASITFDDEGTPGSVLVIFDTFGLVEQEKIKEWVFNFDDALNENALRFAYQAADSTGPAANQIMVDENGKKADGRDGFDIEFIFPQGTTVFGAGETVVYLITSSDDPITASSFNFRVGAFPSAAHVLGIDIPGGEEDGGSGWISTPIPGSVLLLAPGLILLVAVRRKFRSKS
jgi:hypothetical protein